MLTGVSVLAARLVHKAFQKHARFGVVYQSGRVDMDRLEQAGTNAVAHYGKSALSRISLGTVISCIAGYGR